MKVIEIPSTIRIFVSNSATQDQINQIAQECMRGDFALIEAGDIPEFEKKIKEYISADSSVNVDLIHEIDVWANLDGVFKSHRL